MNMLRIKKQNRVNVLGGAHRFDWLPNTTPIHLNDAKTQKILFLFSILNQNIPYSQPVGVRKMPTCKSAKLCNLCVNSMDNIEQKASKASTKEQRQANCE